MSGTTVLFVFANKLTTAADAIVLQYTAPIFVVIFSIIVFKKRMRALDAASALFVFAGIALFFFDQLRADAMLGNILACFAGIMFAGVFVINKMPGAKPEESVLLGHIINTVAALPFIFMSITLEAVSWGSITLLGIFQLGLAYVLFAKGIKLTSPITASLIATLEPLLNPVWVLIFSGEKPGTWALIGGAVVIATVVIYNIADTRSSKKETVSAENEVSSNG
jgi:drug/metabolite transporter (DMT)-like permease